VPPLRERPEDVSVLLNHFLAMFSEAHSSPVPELTPDALKALVAYQWPGNVRELRNIAERLVLRSRDGHVDLGMLPPEVMRERRELGVTADVTVRATVIPAHQVLFQRLISDGASFWSEVYEPFMARDLTRNEVRELIRLGLEHTRGNYKMLVTSFNMPQEDYKKFLNFLRKYQCHVPFQRFRMMPASLPGRSTQVASA
jgi:DNA-binding NtrC family response regulator